MKMALDGNDREEIAAELDAKFGAADRGALAGRRPRPRRALAAR